MDVREINRLEDYLLLYSQDNSAAKSSILTIFQSDLPLEGKTHLRTYRVDNSRLPSTLHLGLLPVIPIDPYTEKTTSPVTVSRKNHLRDKVFSLEHKTKAVELMTIA